MEKDVEYIRKSNFSRVCRCHITKADFCNGMTSKQEDSWRNERGVRN